MVDPKWDPEDGPVTITFLKDSIASDHIKAVMNDAIHTWNKGAQILVLGQESSMAQSDGPTDRELD